MPCQEFVPIQERAILHARDQNIFDYGDANFQGKQRESNFKCVVQSMTHETNYLIKISKPLPCWNKPKEVNRVGLSPLPLNNPLWWEDETDCCDDGFIDLPEDFIPPRHCFFNKKGNNSTQGTHPAKDTLPEGFVHLRDKDVVCGRGAPTMLHPGNQAYRSLIQKHETDYLWAKRSDKPVIAMQIMETLKRQDVRFVRKEGNSRGWLVLDENKIYEKVCQSLREGAPELRRKILASDARKKVGQSKSWAGSLDVDQENNAPILYI
jgi:hypothetical protein